MKGHLQWLPPHLSSVPVASDSSCPPQAPGIVGIGILVVLGHCPSLLAFAAIAVGLSSYLSHLPQTGSHPASFFPVIIKPKCK
jgi:hypothetical protein